MSMVENRKYSVAAVIKGDFALIRERVIDALSKEGFGILTEIDVAATLKKKLGVEVRPYVILGACNPPLAHRALTEEPDLGVLLPCNVIVYAHGDGVCTVAALDPVRQFSLVENPKVEPVAEEVRAGMVRVIEAVRDTFPV
jgi:uncharacterized protein (DUF302 family)